MGVQDNAECIRRGYDAFNSSDLVTLTELIAEDVVYDLYALDEFWG